MLSAKKLHCKLQEHWLICRNSRKRRDTYRTLIDVQKKNEKIIYWITWRLDKNTIYCFIDNVRILLNGGSKYYFYVTLQLVLN